MNKTEQKRVKNAVLDAIDYFGGTKAGLAKALGVSEGLIYHWVSLRAPVSLKKACLIQKVTCGSVKVKDLVDWMPEKLK